MLREFEITCPECSGFLVIDLDTGEVLRHGKRKPGGGAKKEIDPRKFQEAMDRVKRRDDPGNETFDDAVRAVEKQKRRLEDAFEEAKRRAKENPDDRPVNPLDDRFS